MTLLFSFSFIFFFFFFPVLITSFLVGHREINQPLSVVSLAALCNSGVAILPLLLRLFGGWARGRQWLCQLLQLSLTKKPGCFMTSLSSFNFCFTYHRTTAEAQSGEHMEHNPAFTLGWAVCATLHLPLCSVENVLHAGQFWQEEQALGFTAVASLKLRNSAVKIKLLHLLKVSNLQATATKIQLKIPCIFKSAVNVVIVSVSGVGQWFGFLH